MKTGIKRGAVLLSCAADVGSARGVTLLKQYLLSGLGGGWTESEILCSSIHSSLDIRQIVTEVRGCDFGLIYYSGAGGMRQYDRPWREMYAQLKSSETVAESEFNPGTPRCTIIFDCSEEVVLTDDMFARTPASLSRINSNVLDWSRKIFDAALNSAELGLVKVFASIPSSGKCSSVTFVEKLINAASAWAPSHGGVLRYDNAMGAAVEAFTQEVPNGEAKYFGGRRRVHFPFAVVRSE